MWNLTKHRINAIKLFDLKFDVRKMGSLKMLLNINKFYLKFALSFNVSEVAHEVS